MLGGCVVVLYCGKAHEMAVEEEEKLFSGAQESPLICCVTCWNFVRQRVGGRKEVERWEWWMEDRVECAVSQGTYRVALCCTVLECTVLCFPYPLKCVASVKSQPLECLVGPLRYVNRHVVWRRFARNSRNFPTAQRNVGWRLHRDVMHCSIRSPRWSVHVACHVRPISPFPLNFLWISSVPMARGPCFEAHASAPCLAHASCCTVPCPSTSRAPTLYLHCSLAAVTGQSRPVLGLVLRRSPKPALEFSINTPNQHVRWLHLLLPSSFPPFSH